MGFVFNFIKFFNELLTLPFDISIRIFGQKLFANTPDRILALFFWKFKILERHELGILKKIIQKEMIVIDIGANIGLYTSILSKLVGDKGKVFAFEPDPNNFRLLKKCITTNNLRNVTLEQKAISNHSHQGYLYQSGYNSGDNRIYKSNNNFKKTIIDIITLDNYFKKIPKINFIKMDVQGSENLAFMGMQKIILKNKNITIFSEFCPTLLKKCGSTPKDFLKNLIISNLNIYTISSNKKIIKIYDNNINSICKIKGYVNILITNNNFNNNTYEELVR